MELTADIEIKLKNAQGYLLNERVVEVDVSPVINMSQFALQPNFSFDSGAFNSVKVDEATGSRVVISLKNNIQLQQIEDELAVRYYATAQNGEQATGRIVFPDVQFNLAVSPITFELDACCSLPDKIIINVRDYNGGRPISLTNVGDNNKDAATITLIEQEGSDYNDDYNDDFGMDPNQLIVYTLNKKTDFWRTLAAQDRFEYFISYKGKTASNFITVKLKN